MWRIAVLGVAILERSAVLGDAILKRSAVLGVAIFKRSAVKYRFSIDTPYEIRMGRDGINAEKYPLFEMKSRMGRCWIVITCHRSTSPASEITSPEEGARPCKNAIHCTG